MRWKVKGKPKIGDMRTVKKFLLFPLKLEDEIRWLETAHIVERYANGIGWYSHRWYRMKHRAYSQVTKERFI